MIVYIGICIGLLAVSAGICGIAVWINKKIK